MKILLDVGHGGNDSGAIGCYDDTEKRVNLEIANYCRKYLYNDYGIVADLTRSDDTTVTLQDRVSMANTYSYDLFISIHCNADAIQEINSDNSIKGTEIYYSITGEEDRKIAECIINSITENGFCTKRGIKTRTGSDGRDYYYVIRKTKMHALIVESFFIDDVDDYDYFIKRLDLFGKSIADGIARYFGISKQDTEKSVTYSVQVGNFRVRKNAENLVEQLKKENYDAFIVEKVL